MAQRLLLTDERTRTPSPFGFFALPTTPDNSEGVNGDYCFVYSNDGAGIYKKIEGKWYGITNQFAYFCGFTTGNSQVITKTAPFSQITVTGFLFKDEDNLQVEIDGIEQFEIDNYTKTSADLKITFVEEVFASPSTPVSVFIGKYAGNSIQGFIGFDGTNSQVFDLIGDTTYVTPSFSITSDGLYRVEIDGFNQYEGAWTRDTINGRINFSETLPAGTRVFIGKYTGAGPVGFTGFGSTNSELFNLTTDTDNVTVTNFTITTGAKLKVLVDGQARYETIDWTRNTGTNKIEFLATIAATATHPSNVFVGRYD